VSRAFHQNKKSYNLASPTQDPGTIHCSQKQWDEPAPPDNVKFSNQGTGYDIPLLSMDGVKTVYCKHEVGYGRPKKFSGVAAPANVEAPISQKRRGQVVKPIKKIFGKGRRRRGQWLA
jgi:hypothetical protein